MTARATILQGDVLAVLRTLPSDHFGCVITSPPYWGLRDYGTDGQIGLEPTLGDHIAKMVEVFEEVRRVLHPAGTCWVNYGDCYATTPNGRSSADTKAAGDDDRTYRDKPMSTIGGAIKPKDLCMMPSRFAIAMQEAGWWVRADITWAKPNPMPDSSARYRPGAGTERIFLFAKSDTSDFYVARDTGEIRLLPDLSETCPLITRPDQMANRWIMLGHYYDAESVLQGLAPTSVGRLAQNIEAQKGSNRANGGRKTNGNMKAVGGNKQRGHSRRHDGFNDRWDAMTKEEQSAGGRYLRNWEPAPAQVWEIATKPFRESHFATFPPELVARCIQAGCPPGLPILDPFGGSGTTALVADAFGFDSTLIELNPKYVGLARRRLAAGLVMMDTPASPDSAKPAADDRQGTLL